MKKEGIEGQKKELLSLLQKRFEQNMHRHEGLEWEGIEKRLISHGEKLLVLQHMEDTGGEPDVVSYDKEREIYLFFDCSKESPDRRSLCYDEKALEERKKNKPQGSALGLAKDMGIELLTEEQYRYLQTLGEFDLKTSSWIKTPERIRKQGGALFCDRRYDTVFVYHNGADSYYASRGFRGCVEV